MQVLRLAGDLVNCLLIALLSNIVLVAPAAADDVPVPSDGGAPLLRVFLTDGRSLSSYGEYARVGGRVVFSMPTSVAVDHPTLHLVDLPADRVDWTRTLAYAEASRASHYLRTRADADYALLTGDIAQALNDISMTTDPRERVAIVERARRTLADWPPAHYNYKRDEVRAMLGMLDEAIAELRAAAGADRFDVSLVASVAVAPALEALLPPPSVQELIEQSLAVARITDVPAERTSLLSVVVAAIDRHAEDLPAEWARAARENAAAWLAHELQIDRSYRALGAEMMTLATARARTADVRGVERVMGLVSRRDAALGSTRPDALNGILNAVQDQLDAARRLRLARDRWAIRLPELRHYRDTIGASLTRLSSVAPALEDIKALSGSGPDAIGAILRAAAAIQKVVSAVVPPDEMKELHALFLSAVQMAESAAKLRREAALTGDMERAWNASSAAAGALMLAARAASDLQLALRAPQLPR